MLHKIGSTFITRILIALISLLLVIVSARELGPSGVGTIGLFILNVSIITLIDGFFAGPALAYFARKIPFYFALLLSLIAAFFGSILFLFFYFVLPISLQINIIDLEFLWLMVGSSVFVSLTLSFSSILLGFEKVNAVNVISLFQFLLLLLIVSLQFYGLKIISTKAYLLAYLISYMAACFLAFVLILKNSRFFAYKTSSIRQLLRGILSYSFWAQLANLVQTLNYRISFYFLNIFSSRAKLGVFANANQIAEGLWLPAKSIALVQYSKIVNTHDFKTNVKLTVHLLNYSVFITAILSAILLAIPANFYSFLFKHPEFEQIRVLLLILSPGILALVITMILAHFFSGIGKPKVNFVISLSSLIMLIFCSWVFIPNFGLRGAAIASSATYLLGAILSLVWFLRMTKIPYIELLIQKSDFKQHINQIKAIIFFK